MIDTGNILDVYCVFLLFFHSIYPTTPSRKDLYDRKGS